MICLVFGFVCSILLVKCIPVFIICSLEPLTQISIEQSSLPGIVNVRSPLMSVRLLGFSRKVMDQPKSKLMPMYSIQNHVIECTLTGWHIIAHKSQRIDVREAEIPPVPCINHALFL